MILFFVLLVLFIIYNKKNRRSLTTYILLYYLASLTGTLLLSPSKFAFSEISLLNHVFLILTILCITLCWRKFLLNKPIILTCDKQDSNTIRWLVVLGSALFVINLITIVSLRNVVTDFSAFKNEGDSSYYYQMVPLPGFILGISGLLSPVMLITLVYHFYYLISGNLKWSTLSLLSASNFVLIGLAAFSRSNVVVFLVVYVFVFLLFRKQINPSLKRSFYAITSITGTVIFAGLVAITINRFIGEAGQNLYSAKAFVLDDSIFKDPILVSQLSYFSQWYFYAVDNLAAYNGEMVLNWSHPVFNIFAERIMGWEQLSDQNLQLRLMHIFKDRYGFFMGISTNILYDMGYILGMIFFIAFYVYVSHMQRKDMNITDMMLVVSLLLVPLMGIFNSALNSINIHMMIMTIISIKIYKKLVSKR